jgi:hypothetical protein
MPNDKLIEAIAKAHAVASKPLANDPLIEESDRFEAKVFLAMLEAAGVMMVKDVTPSP